LKTLQNQQIDKCGGILEMQAGYA